VASGKCDKCKMQGCTGTAVCKVGYRGFMCGFCDGGYWEDTNTFTCHPCGKTSTWVLVIIGLVAVLLTVLLLKFNNSPLLRPLAVPLRTGFVYIQGNEPRADFGLWCMFPPVCA